MTSPVQAPRFRAPGWKDVRVIIGVLLVIASIAATWVFVNASTKTVRVWAAAEALVPGATVSAQDVVATEVNLSTAAQQYLSAGTPIPSGSTVLVPVGAGELIAVSHLGSADQLAGRVLALSIADRLPAAVDKGSRVDIWATDPDDLDPRQILQNAAVIAVEREGSDFAAAAGTRIEVFVPNEKLTEVLKAQAGEHRISVAAVPQRQVGATEDQSRG